MSVALVFGATGYIGHAVARALRRDGYTVYGVLRTPEKEVDLKSVEVIPLLADALKPESYQHIVQRAQVVIDAQSPGPQNPTAASRAILSSVEAAFVNNGGINKKTFIYTSGLLTVADKEEEQDENYVEGNPGMSWRREWEREILSSNKANSIVLSPGYVYGYLGGNYAAGQIFNIKDNTVVIRGRGDKRWTWVHVDDVADAFVRAAQRAPTVAGHVFFIGAYNTRTCEEIALKAARVAGHSNVEIKRVQPEGWFVNEEISCRVSSRKAQQMLGWQPKRPDFYDDLEIYYNCWLAAQSK